MTTIVDGDIALLTGGARGMAYGLASKFLKDGGKVIIVDINQKALDEAEKELKKEGTVYAYKCDIGSCDDIHELADKVHNDVGLIDILVNAAGYVTYGGTKFLDQPEETYKKTIDINVMGIMWMTRAFLPDLIKKRRGHVINFASSAGLLGVPLLATYCASKHAVIGFTESIEHEMSMDGLMDVRLSAVCPLVVETGMFKGLVTGPIHGVTTENAVEIIYNGMRENRSMIGVPPYAPAAIISKLIDKPILYKLLKAVGMDLADWTVGLTGRLPSGKVRYEPEKE